MKSIFATVLLTAAVSPAYIAVHYAPVPPGTQIVGERTGSAASHGLRFDTMSVKDTADTTPLIRPAFPVVGRPAIQIRAKQWLNAGSGAPVKFGDGHVYVLDFTAPWCGSCPRTYPYMTDIVKQYGAQGVRGIYMTAIWGLAEDHFTSLEAADEMSKLPEYFTRHQVTEPVAVYDSLRWYLRDYGDSGPVKGSTALPKVIVIDGKGIVRESLSGWDSEKARKQVFATVEASLASAKAPSKRR